MTKRNCVPSSLLLCLPLLACGQAAPDGAADGGANTPDADPGATQDASVQPPDATRTPDAGPQLNCAQIPQGPFTLTQVGEAIASEDLAFDAEGHVIGSDDTAIFKTKYNGSPSVFVPNFEFRAGLRYLPNGHLVVNDDNRGELVRIDTDGVKHIVLSGLAYPNGLAVDPNGYVYLTEHDARRVRRIDPMTGDYTLLVDGQIENPNGITFNTDFTKLYIAGFSGVGTIYELPIAADGTPGQLTPFKTGVGTGWLDGLAVDACGNVYVCDYEDSRVYRIDPAGQDIKMIIDGSGDSQFPYYLPNLQWGSGVGGWDTNKLYLPAGFRHRVLEVDIGVPGKSRVYPQ